jgi:hypothetical protein
MQRLILLEIVVFLSAFGVSYLLRLIAGRAIRGFGVVLWGALFGMVGALVGSYIIETSLAGARFLWTDGDIWGLLAIAFRFFLLTSLVGGILGALFASLPRRRREGPKPVTPPGKIDP